VFCKHELFAAPHAQARHWLGRAFATRVATRWGAAFACEVADTGALLVEVLERSAGEVMAKGLDWAVAKAYYEQAAGVCERAWPVLWSAAATAGGGGGGGDVAMVEAEALTGTEKTLGPPAMARLLWHAAVVASWQLAYKEAWRLIRKGSGTCRGRCVLALFFAVVASVVLSPTQMRH
jgi:hypothetical protein